jgi:hypothetical protein
MAKAQEATEVTESADEISEILNSFNAGVDSDKGEDEVKMDMIGAGATFKNVTRLYNQYMIDTGRSMSKEAKTTLLDDNLNDAPLDTEEGFKAAVAVVVKKGKNVTDGSAASLIRAWAKKNETECYKAPASEGTRNPFVPNYHKALIANPAMTEQGLKDVIEALEKDEWKVNPTRWFNQQNAIRKMVNAVNAKLTGAEAEAA